MRSCVVIPTYNERENIEEVITRVLKNDVNILIVDDGSPDGTGELVTKLAEIYPGRIELESRSGKQGLGKAYVFGFNKCIAEGYDVICQMDADLSHDPDVLDDLISPVLNRQADLVIGSRYVDGGSIPKWTLLRRLLSRGGNLYTRLLLNVKTHDATAGFRAYNAEFLAKVLETGIEAEGYGFQIEMTYCATRLKGKIIEMPISFADREHGTSKMGGFIIVEALTKVTLWAVRDRVIAPIKRLFSHKDKKVADTNVAVTKIDDETSSSMNQEI